MMVPVYACLEKIQAEPRDVYSHLESNRFTNSLQKAGSFQLVAAPTHIQGGKYQILDFLLTSLLISLLFIQVHWTMSTCNECLGYCGFRIG